MTRTPHFSPATSNHHFQPDGSSASHHHQHLSPQATLSPPRPNPVTSKSDPARHPESSNYASQSSSTHQRYHSRPDVFTELPSTDHLRRSYDMTQRDPEKAAQLFLPRHPEPTHSRKGRAGRDPEKQSYDTHNPSASMTSTAPLASPSHPSTISYTWEDLPQVPDTYEGHLARILVSQVLQATISISY